MTEKNYQDIFLRSKEASRGMLTIEEGKNVATLLTLADLLESNQAELLKANAEDLSRMDPANPLYDRLKLTPERIAGIASDVRNVAHLPSPVGETVEERVLPNGIELRKVRVPYGVIGVIYEARPNVTFGVFSLCFRSGNACILKGGHDADSSNRAAIGIIHEALRRNGINEDVATLFDSSHEAATALLNAVGFVDVCIPRGGRRLIDYVRDNAKVPVIETGAGVVSAYFDASGDLEMGKDIVRNAKTRRVSVCNALDTLLVNRSRLEDLYPLVADLAEKEVEIYADEDAYGALEGKYPSSLLKHSFGAETWSREWMDYKMGLKTVDSTEEAIAHIAEYGSGHSETIITQSEEEAEKYRRRVDASCVYVNLPTSFTDGAQFGLGAEIGISTQKLGPRGPMGLREITTTKYLLNGHGQTRP